MHERSETTGCPVPACHRSIVRPDALATTASCGLSRRACRCDVRPQMETLRMPLLLLLLLGSMQVAAGAAKKADPNDCEGERFCHGCSARQQ